MAKLNRLGNWFNTILAFAVIGGLIFGAYKTLNLIFDKFSNLKPEVSVAVIASCSTVFISVLSILLSKYWERKQQIRQDHHAKKVVVYEKFIELWFDVLFAGKTGKQNPIDNEKLFMKKMSPIIKQMIPWAGDDVIKSFVAFRETAAHQEGDDPKNIMLAFESFLISIRKDLGHSCKRLQPGDLSKIFINDYHKYEDNN